MVEPVRLTTPISEDTVRKLRAGDTVLISGLMATGRDRIHKHLVENRPNPKDIPFELSGGVLYHCGPVVRKTDEGYEAMAAGPTTSMRVEMYEADVINGYGIRAVVGKGGMGPKTMEALKLEGCVYMHTIGGAAVYLAAKIRKTTGVWMLDEFGAAEAMWFFEVEDFPAVVTMDCKGNDVHRDIEELSLGNLKKLNLR